MTRMRRASRELVPSVGMRLWVWYSTCLSILRKKDHRSLRILREAGPVLTLLGLTLFLPDRFRNFQDRDSLDALIGFLFGSGATWTVIFGFTRLPDNGWRWVRFLGMGALGVVGLLVAAEGLARMHNGFFHAQGGRAWAESLASMPAFLAACALTILFALFFSRIERHRREALEQRHLAEEAQGAALRAKLAPHFIFNTLNVLKAQIAMDPAAAEAMTHRMAQLFRQVLEVSDEARIPLGRELAFVEAYLGIEQARLGDRLRVSLEVPEELESSLIPPLSLQVLVENAVKHGVAPLEQGGGIRIGVERHESTLYVWVEDPGTGASPNKGTGTALETLRQRLGKPEDLEMGLVDGRHRVGFRWRQA